MDSVSEAHKLLKAVDRVLPNIRSYLCEVLKQEKLSLEAEALRARYEAMLLSIEKATREPLMLTPPTIRNSGQRNSSVELRLKAGQFNTLPARRKTEGDFPRPISNGFREGPEVIPDKPIEVPEIAGPLLWRDNHQRWHRRHCRLIPSKKILTIHENPEDTQFLLSISLVGANISYLLQDCDKDLCFAVEPTGEITLTVPVDQFSPVTNSNTRHIFAAYSEGDFTKWQTTLEHVVSHSRPISQWAESVISATSLGQDSVFSGSSGGTEGDSGIHGRPPPPPIPEPDDDDNLSDCTIYEDIDELVQQCDVTMQETAEAMNLVSPKKPKKTKKSQNNNNKDISEHKQKLEIGERYHGYLYKRTGNSWKKKWCQLKGCVFCYSKSPDDTNTHDYILLRADIMVVKDAKKDFAFRLACKGVKEIYLAADEEEEQLEWLSRLQSASQREVEFPLLGGENATKDNTSALPEGIYNVPRILQDEVVYDVPPTEPNESIPIGSGIYDVPRSLLSESVPQSVVGAHGMEFQLTGNPFDTYDIPRSIQSPEYYYDDDETIYDYPLDFDLDDMEIYDYPPDAIELGILEETGSQGSGPNRDSSSDSSSNPRTPASGEGTLSSAGSGSNRMSSATLGSIEDMAFPALGDGFRSLPHNTSQQVESFLSSIIENRADTSIDTDIPISSLEYGQTSIKGSLFRKERLKWSRCFCLIRNSFLECHKNSSSAASSQKPILKLLLLGSQVLPNQDSKRQWSFQLKHPRREGYIVFAAENESDYRRWMEAFQAASSIEVQQVTTMDEIRINDSDLKRKWRSLEKGLQDQNKPHEETIGGSNGKGSPTGSEEDDTVSKGKRRLTWSKMGGSHRRSKSGSEKELHRDAAHKKSNEALDEQRNQTDGEKNKVTERLRKTVSGDILPSPVSDTALGPQILSGAHRAISPEGLPCFQGYLRVKSSKEDKWARQWCVLENFEICCYTNQRNLTLVHQVSLCGSTIVRADEECKKKFSFRVWNSQTLKCFYFSAVDEQDYTSWFNEVIKEAEQVTPSGSFEAVVYYYPNDQRSGSQDHVTSRSSHMDATQLPPGIIHHGLLKKRSDKGQWNSRYCRLRETHLYVYYTSSDQTPITVLAIQHCTVERADMPQESEKFIFNVTVKGGKTHVFGATDNQDLKTWLKFLEECIKKGPPQQRPRSGSKGSKDKPKETQRKSPLLASHGKNKSDDLVSHVPASDLVNPTHTGYCELQFKASGPWLRHWCIVHENMLYIYQNQDSKSTVKTIVLPGYKIESLGSRGKKLFGICLAHSESPSFNLAANDQVDLTRWFMALEAASKAEISLPKQEVVDTSKTESMVPKTENMPPKTKDLDKEKTDKTPSTDLSISKVPESSDSYVEKRAALIDHFEKHIHKTHKVSQTTEKNLKKQQDQLKTVQDKFTEHIKRLESLPNASEMSQAKIKEMKIKNAQIGKILPYLEKYILVNRQAELQTVAILKEKCIVKCQELDAKYKRKGTTPVTMTTEMSRQQKTQSMPSGISSAGLYNSLSRPRKSKKGKKHVPSSDSIDGDPIPAIQPTHSSQQPSLSPILSPRSTIPDQTHDLSNPSETTPSNQPDVSALHTEPMYDVVQQITKPQAKPPTSEHYVELLHPRVVHPPAATKEEPVQYAIISRPKTSNASMSNESPKSDEHALRGLNDSVAIVTTVEEKDSESPLVFTSPAGQEVDDPLTTSTISETSLGQFFDEIFEQVSFSLNESEKNSSQKMEPSLTTSELRNTSDEQVVSLNTTNLLPSISKTGMLPSAPLEEPQFPPPLLAPVEDLQIPPPPPPPPAPIEQPQIPHPPPPPPAPVKESQIPPPPPPPAPIEQPKIPHSPPPPPAPVKESQIPPPPPPPPPPPSSAPVKESVPLRLSAPVKEHHNKISIPTLSSEHISSKTDPSSFLSQPLSHISSHNHTPVVPLPPTTRPKPPPTTRPKHVKSNTISPPLSPPTQSKPVFLPPKQPKPVKAAPLISSPSSLPQVQSKTFDLSAPPPPPKTKPKRPRSSTTPTNQVSTADHTLNNSHELIKSDELPDRHGDVSVKDELSSVMKKSMTLAERMKAFQ